MTLSKSNVTPAVSVLIPAFNEAGLIASSIDSVHMSFRTLARPDYEIIVCDNNSTDATPDIARSKGALVVFEPHNQISRARNSAARAAKGAWLIFLDADTKLNPELLRETMTLMESGRVGAGGAVVALEGNDLSRFVHQTIWVWNFASVTFGWAAGAYIFCHRDAWTEAGGFDEQVYASEEIWFAHKLKRWCRRRRLKFRIITETPIVTSSRKVRWFTQWELMKQFALLSLPSTKRRRELCGIWYERPPAEKTEP